MKAIDQGDNLCFVRIFRHVLIYRCSRILPGNNYCQAGTKRNDYKKGLSVHFNLIVRHQIRWTFLNRTRERIQNGKIQYGGRFPAACCGERSIIFSACACTGRSCRFQDFKGNLFNKVPDAFFICKHMGC